MSDFLLKVLVPFLVALLTTIVTLVLSWLLPRNRTRRGVRALLKATLLILCADMQSAPDAASQAARKTLCSELVRRIFADEAMTFENRVSAYRLYTLAFALSALTAAQENQRSHLERAVSSTADALKQMGDHEFVSETLKPLEPDEML